MGLLDTYHDERHAVDADTLKSIRAQSALLSGLGEPTTELYNVLTQLTSFHEGLVNLFEVQWE